MAQVSIRINGYSYTVGCEDGQEAHLFDMAAQVESRVDTIKSLGSSTSEQRLLVMAALLLADELHDTHRELDSAKAQLAQAMTQLTQATRAAKADSQDEADQRRTAARLADQAELIANQLGEA